MSKEPFYLQLSTGSRELTTDNCGIALFRDNPDMDYLDMWEEQEDGSETHTWLFNNRELVIWMAGAVAREKDRRLLQDANRTHGSFRENAGWNPPVCIEDEASPTEVELYTQSLLQDLNNFTGIEDLPDD